MCPTARGSAAPVTTSQSRDSHELTRRTEVLERDAQGVLKDAAQSTATAGWAALPRANATHDGEPGGLTAAVTSRAPIVWRPPVWATWVRRLRVRGQIHDGSPRE
jgi:hypothetical protein